MAKKHKHEEHENHERWLVSYADFITLLFAFFVVMYSVSSVNEGKYRVVSESIQAALRPVVAPPASSMKVSVGDYKSSIVPTIGKKITIIKQIEAAVSKFDRTFKLKNSATVSTEERGIVVTIADSMLFESGHADLRQEAYPLMEALADALGAGVQGVNIKEIRVEGHTDNVPIRSAQFPSNWELSSLRAVMVARVLTELYAVPPTMVSAAGLGEYRPLADNLTPENRAKNRRVEIIVLTKSSE
jgi:chemotaxis protein MotB